MQGLISFNQSVHYKDEVELIYDGVRIFCHRMIVAALYQRICI